MRRSIRLGPITWLIVLSCGAMLTAGAQPRAHSKLNGLTKASADKLAYSNHSLAQLRAIEPKSPNPLLSLLPVGTKPDMAYWKARMRAEAIARRAAQTQGISRPTIEELEPNDSAATGTPINDFGNGPGQSPATDVRGSFPDPPVPITIGPFMEDDGAIPLASVAPVSSGQLATVSAILGDRPHGSGGSGSGDFDFYAITGVTAGQIITADINTQPAGQIVFDSVLAIWNSDGLLLAINDDARPSNSFFLDSFIQYTAPADGTYYISVGSFGSPVPQNPLDSASGTGFDSEGVYTLVLGLDGFDVDYFSVSLNAGDILNFNGLGNVLDVALFDPAGVELIRSTSDITFILPEAAPFAAGDNPSLLYVIHQPGTYALRVTGNQAGTYLAELRTARPPLETAEPGTKQILFIDFDGEVVDTSIFGIVDRRWLSPLRSFLSNWGLGPDDEDAVINAILAATEENIRADIIINGNNPQFDIEILNSRDHDDPFGQPNVSRVIVGGTIAESRISTIGIAESIDVGNFNTAETGLVLLDLLSAPSGDPNSINSFPIDASASKIAFIAIAQK